MAYREMFSFTEVHRAVTAAVLVPLLAPLFVWPALVFASRIVELDRRVSRDGVVRGMRWILQRYYAGVRTGGAAMPATGAVLIVGNHPGLGDFPALASAIGRDDLTVVIHARSLMRDLHAILDRCIVIDDTLASRADAVRQIVAALGAGKPVVVYPAAHIEPDPAQFSGVSVAADDFLLPWPTVIESLQRRVGRARLEVAVVPALTSHIQHVPRLWRGLLSIAGHRTGCGSQCVDHARRAALITMLQRSTRHRQVRVAFGEPLTFVGTGITHAARTQLGRLAAG